MRKDLMDYEMILKRFEAFFANDMIDRPLISISYPKQKQNSIPLKTYDNHKDRWLDFDYRIESMKNDFSNREYCCETLPIAVPNLGPEIFSAWCGCDYNFGETTTWSEPCIIDLDKDKDKGVLSKSHPLFVALETFTKKLLEQSDGKFIVGLTDFHPGGDHLAALRDPQTLCMDMIDDIDFVKEKLAASYPEYFESYDHFYNLIKAYDMPATSWLQALSTGKFYIPSNDFSCMISKDMFDDVFLEGIISECQFLDHSIYHLDGPGALIHLPSILDIKELNGLQWVCGASNEGYHKWVKVYQAIEKANKAVMLYPTISELDMIFETLKPEGKWILPRDVLNEEQAIYVYNRVKRWK